MRGWWFLVVILLLPSVRIQTTHGSPLIAEENEFMTHYPLNPSNSNTTINIFDAEQDNQGNLWLSSIGDTILYRINLTTMEMEEITLPADLTPFRLAFDGNQTMWFTDYNYEYEVGIDYVASYDIKTGEIQQYEVPTAGAGVFDLEVTEDRIWFSEWLSDKLGYVELATGEVVDFKVESARCITRCGPVGIEITSSGEFWYAETYSNMLVKFDPDAQSYDKVPLPDEIYAPVVLTEATDGRLWTGAHGGNELVALDPQTLELEIINTPGKEDLDAPIPFAGINDLTFDTKGNLWFTEHFTDRLGVYQPENQQIFEFKIPRAEPLVQWLEVVGEELWFPEYEYGILSKINTSNIPQITIQLPQEEQIWQRSSLHELSFEVSSDASFTVRPVVVSEDRGRLVVHDITESFDLQPQQTQSMQVSVQVTNNARITQYFVLVGVDLGTVRIFKELTVNVTENELATIILQGFGPYAIILSSMFLIRYWRKRNASS